MATKPGRDVRLRNKQTLIFFSKNVFPTMTDDNKQWPLKNSLPGTSES